MKYKLTIIFLICITLGCFNYVSAGTHLVKSGDTLSKISTQYYGKAGYWPELQRYNGIADANLIYDGDTLTIPGADVMQAMTQASGLSEKQSIASQAKSNGGSMPSDTSSDPADPAANNTTATTTNGSGLPAITPTESNPKGIFHDPFEGMDVDNAVKITQ